ncbi:MAG TPA: hypothetical protein VG963_24735, partial [Polyangiaceae bacterium]|nr:hypothetical protein [Polyangiaceae bacterium]
GAASYLIESQNAEGTWTGHPELFGPRPLLSHYQTHTHAFVMFGLSAIFAHAPKHAERAPRSGHVAPELDGSL